MKQNKLKVIVSLDFIWIIVVIALFGIIIYSSSYSSRAKEYNKHMCAVYGKMEDCKTPLPEYQRLK